MRASVRPAFTRQGVSSPAGRVFGAHLALKSDRKACCKHVTHSISSLAYICSSFRDVSARLPLQQMGKTWINMGRESIAIVFWIRIEHYRPGYKESYLGVVNREHRSAMTEAARACVGPERGPHVYTHLYACEGELGGARAGQSERGARLQRRGSSGRTQGSKWKRNRGSRAAIRWKERGEKTATTPRLVLQLLPSLCVLRLHSLFIRRAHSTSTARGGKGAL